MARRGARGGDCLQDLETGQGAEVAVEVAARGHRVDVRPEENGRPIAAAGTDEDVAGGIDPRREPGGAGLVEEPRPCGEVGVRVGDAADARRERAAGRPPEGAQPFEPPAQPGAVDARCALRARPAAAAAAHGRCRSDREDVAPAPAAHASFASFSAASTRAGRNGTRRSRTPVASKIALATAASSGLHTVSPAP
jgi:hypothetical protein